MKHPAELDERLRGYHPTVRSIALALRTAVIAEMAPCHEYIFWMRSKVVLLYGTSDRVIDDCVCTISVFAKHVNLGFKRGADLDDPEGLLEGSGAGMRHLKVRTAADLKRPELRVFLRRARRHAGVKRPRAISERRVVTRVKPRPAARPAWPRLS